ncbi:MAG: glycosyltransferase family 39 protein [Bacteroidota bacterium]
MNFTKSITPPNWLLDVRLWILVLFLIRLENINLPPLDDHAWRQAISLGVARNYVEVSSNFFEPRTIICDSREGILAQEFPLFNYGIALLWKVFGQQNWCFRLFNLLVCSLGLLAFSKVCTRLTNPFAALSATVMFGVSVAFMYARKGMPDVFAVSLVIMGVYAGCRFLEEKKSWQLALFFLLSALGMLSKMPAACAMALMVSPVLFGEADKTSKIKLSTAGLLAVAVMAAWYFIWVPITVKTQGFPLFFPTSLAEGWQQIKAMSVETRERFYPIALTSQIAFLFCVIGLGLIFWHKNKALIATFLASVVLVIGYMLKSGGTFSGHAYYVIPFVPMMSLLAGYGLDKTIRNKWIAATILLLIAIEAVYKHKYDFFIPWQDQKFCKLEKIVDQYVPKDARILVNNLEGSPTMMYAAHRRGWTVTDRMKDAAWVSGESTVGMKYLVIERSRWQDSLAFPKLYEDSEFQIYQTTPPVAK